MEQAVDFLAESRALHKLVSRLPESQLQSVTGFKTWTIEDVVRHLYVWNQAADMSLVNPEGFADWVKQLMSVMEADGDLSTAEQKLPNMPSGKALIAAWITSAKSASSAFLKADPSARVAWVGPPMSARSSITARLMETWAHGQEVYDVLGIKRQNEDRIRNIVVLGVNTFGWSFKVRQQAPPGPMPHLHLIAPSGAIWRYGDETEGERIEGLAEEFCQVVTQTRNVADTQLVISGPTASAWMSNAQCFAGGPVEPPKPGSRKPSDLADF